MSFPSESTDGVSRPTQLERVETRDGSSTLYDPERDAHFSSLHGARTESRHVFVEGTGLPDRSGEWRVLELGFGAGINFQQTAKMFDSRGHARRLEYHAVDYAPVAPDDVPLESSPYADAVREVLDRISPPAVDSGAADIDGPPVKLVLHPTDWRDLDLAEFRANALYYDPFDPKREPESWRLECFEVARAHMAERAILATYSAASDVKRAMFRADFAVATAPGPGPKREITFASPSEPALAKLPWAELLSPSRYLDVSDD